MPRGQPSAAQRLSRLMQDGRYRRLVVAYDERDHPPWTVELYDGRKLLGLRSGATLQHAISRMQEAERVRLSKRAPSPLRS